jgi:enoyl-CoA hydratase/carnithine racemase
MTSAEMSAFLRVTREDHVAVLTIDRPEKRNAMTAGMWAALPGVLAPLADDPTVRTLIVTGAGPSFCAGADISDLLSGGDPADPMADVRRDNLAAQAALRDFPKPTVAMIRGHCIGGGVEIAASCDLRFTDPTGVFGVTPAKVGIVYTPRSTKALIDLVGPAMTKYLLFSGELIDASTALRARLVDQVVPAEDLETEVQRFAAGHQGDGRRAHRRRRRRGPCRPPVPGDDRQRGARRRGGRVHRPAAAALPVVRPVDRFRFGCAPPGVPGGHGAP